MTVRTSVLDLGSNSFHVLVAEADPGGEVIPLLREREMLHLGAIVAEHGHIPSEQRRRAVEVVAHLTELARRAGAEERLAVATSALRDASDGPDVVAEMSDVAGVPIRVLDGLQEARLAYLGARASVATDDDPVLVLDLGGGSLELAVGRGADVVWSASTELGVSRLSTLVREDPPTPAGLERVAARVVAELAPHVDRLERLAPARVVAVGGTVRALARVVAATEHAWLPATLNRLEVTADHLAAARHRLTSLDLEGRLEVEGMKRRRADHLHIAAEILHHAVARLGVDRLEVSDWGLREGTLLDALGVTAFPPAVQMRRQAVERVRRSFVADDPHAPHVTRLALRLFDQTREVHGLDDHDRELLEHAAQLHSVGESLALRRQHEHGAYLVQNAELRGLSPGELAAITTLVRYHRSRGISSGYPPYAAMAAWRRDRTERMLPLLQLADALDRTRDRSVDDVTARVTDGRLELTLHGHGLHVPRLELERRATVLQRVYGLTLEVHEG